MRILKFHRLFLLTWVVDVNMKVGEGIVESALFYMFRKEGNLLFMVL